MLKRHCRIGATYTKQPCLQPLRLRFPCTTDRPTDCVPACLPACAKRKAAAAAAAEEELSLAAQETQPTDSIHAMRNL